jgi:hypothetical protein
MTATGSKVTVIEDVFSLFMSQTLLQDSVNTTMIQSVTDDKVAMRMMANTTTFFTRDIKLKTLGLEIKKDISIPWVGGVDEEQSLIKERISGLSIFISMGKVVDKLHKHQRFFTFGLNKFAIKLLKYDDPFRIFSHKNLMCQNVIHGVTVYDNCDSA